MNGTIKDKNRALIRLVYEKTRSDGPQSTAPLLDNDFVARIGDSVPWGGIYQGPDHYLGTCVRQYSLYLEPTSVIYETLNCQDDEVHALVQFKMHDGDATVPFLHTWTIRGEKVIRLNSVCLQPGLLSATPPSIRKKRPKRLKLYERLMGIKRRQNV
ncbi:hypothetical protein ACTJJ7_01385 [Phyllobacterium sp. 22229]|uniref:SnoaL-like domain-containing protein n=1 Tax=Phyllobacterium myrsinacearum TaxID=28101 RepID=A0A2S9JYU4_9HYPH|nr:hypothetical protein [Phyllobacterium myrsinacearum]PRD58511.1 hypothetical protein C5750_05220 [Phyllobacterium myrsinacearum]PWV96754.1 hypothetical protein DEV92_101744 [Phyllobacterium myrsinacearum]RZS89267.1 hypothetical protein EV217_1670 [Phyllobacterium myrsinacearum]RZV09254.1 hypothetical protein EV654_0343 [Phyllobacterium myrsinacearum]